MALEFTRLSDVALVEEAAETANVLIEEGGEIKRVPKTEVGGGGKAEYDAIFEIKVYTDDEGITLISGDYTAVRDKIMVQQEEPKIKVICKLESYGLWNSVNSTNITVLYNEEEGNDMLYIVMDGINGYGVSSGYYMVWYPDNTIEGVYS